jgi:hypothetical protein
MGVNNVSFTPIRISGSNTFSKSSRLITPPSANLSFGISFKFDDWSLSSIFSHFVGSNVSVFLDEYKIAYLWSLLIKLWLVYVIVGYDNLNYVLSLFIILFFAKLAWWNSLMRKHCLYCVKMVFNFHSYFLYYIIHCEVQYIRLIIYDATLTFILYMILFWWKLKNSYETWFRKI